ncbi:putative serine esterase DUF676 [Necator americanus]|uniref:Putative serine esterase DUF676 n=1 Tax=Necator americanus TaxID=51031 RepID=W2TYI0_NECAM|nr:putative serine esterase DUF676 [Necator americanus]ETN86111.1 putative serine esterase DUF676 [Necator americanus]
MLISLREDTIRNIKEMVTSVNIEPCDVNIEMESLKCRLETATNPWVELEDVTISASMHFVPGKICEGYCVIAVRKQPSPSTIGPMGDGLPILRHDPLRINSRFPWFRRKSVNAIAADSCRSPQLCLEQQPLSVFPPEQDLSMVVDFVVERERMKLDLQEQRLFDGFIYSEQAILRHGGDVRKPGEQPTHLVVFVHGLEGTCDDLSSYRNVFRIIAGDTPGFHYLLSSSNHTKTWSDIDEMAENLLSEVQSYVLRYSEPPVRVSFVAHSLGGVIVRAAVCRDEAEWLRPRLHCLMTINSPHLGLAYVGKGRHALKCPRRHHYK